MNRPAQEINFDGLPGPLHNYAGLAYGNIASISSKRQISNPKAAALQGLEKMKFLADLGVKQAILPPHERPYIPMLKELGFSGSDADILQAVAKHNPEILEQCSSASAMWVANAATVIPSIDSVDGHVHFIPANLSAKFHRSIEAETTSRVLRAIFPNPVFFTHHSPLPSFLTDEGAANHTRFCQAENGVGLHFFVYGKHAFKVDGLFPKIFPARQTAEASEGIARIAKIYPQRLQFAQANPTAIDAGVFHNDVACVGHRNLILYHEQAFLSSLQILNDLRKKMEEVCGTHLLAIEVKAEEMSLQDAVKSYFFNSQLVTRPSDGLMFLLAPDECRSIPSATRVIERILEENDNPIDGVRFFDLTQSMRNGGGPACLRLRMTFTSEELKEINPAVLLNERLYEKLKNWIEKYYREEITPRDIADPKLYQENTQALDALTKILNLGPIYDFQR